MKTTLKIAAICALLAPASAFAQTVENGEVTTTTTTNDSTANSTTTYEEPTEAIEVTDAMMDEMRVAIAEAGCTVTNDAQAAIVEANIAYDEETLEAIVEKLRVYEEIVDASEDGGITLVSGDCAN